MSKGVKRKVSTKEGATVTRAKRVRASRRQPEPEYVQDQRNLQDLWKAAHPIGTELELVDSVYKYDWDFSNLEKEFEEGGKFHGIGNNKVYLFGQTEFRNDNDCRTLIPTPVAVVAPRPPSMEIGIRSVQREESQKVMIVPMRQMKMDWIPYIPLEQREGWSERAAKSSGGSNLPQIFVIGCTQRKASLKQMKEDRWKKFQYCMPYMMNPIEEEENLRTPIDTVVDILFPMEPKAPLIVRFDWDMDGLEEFTNELIKAEKLTEDVKEAFMAFVEEEVTEARRERREERRAKMRILEELPNYEEARAYCENMRLYKIYPVQTPNTPSIPMKSKYINYYYGKAHEII